MLKSSLLAIAFVSAATVPASAFVSDAPPVYINVIAPEAVSAGLADLVAAYGKDTGTGVKVTVDSLDKIVGDVKTGTPVADVVILPTDLMAGLDKSGGLAEHTRKPLVKAQVDTDVAVNARTERIEEARSFVRYITRPSTAAVWKAKGADLR